MAFLFMGNAILVASAALILTKMGASDLQIGIIATSYYLGGVVSTMTSHRIVSNVGHIRSFAIFSSLLALSGLMHMAILDAYAWILFRFVLGYSYYSILMIIESWLNTRTKNHIRSRVLSVYEGVFYLSFGVGVLILGFGLDTTKTFVISLGFLMFCVIPISLLRVKEPSLPQKMKISIPNVFSTSKLAFITAFIAGMLINSYSSMSGVYILKLGYTEKEFSYFLTSALLGGFVGQSFIGIMSDKYGRKIAIVFTSLVSLLFSSLMMFFTEIYMLYVFSFFLGMNVFCLYILALARANDQAQRDQIVEVARTILFGYSIGSVVAPILLGQVMAHFGARGFSLFYVCALCVLLVFASFRRIIPANKRKKLVNVPKTIVNIEQESFKDEEQEQYEQDKNMSKYQD